MFFKIKKQQHICFHNSSNVTLFAISWQYSIYSKIKAVLKALEAPDLLILTHFKKSSKKIKQETDTKHFSIIFICHTWAYQHVFYKCILQLEIPNKIENPSQKHVLKEKWDKKDPPSPHPTSRLKILKL